jgi:hypothetical protein
MPDSVKRCAAALALTALTSCLALSQAAGAPTATSAAGNSISATATLDTSYDPYFPTTRITGQIVAKGHKYGPRQCLRDREVWAYWTDLSGQTVSTDADNPTNKKGRFTFTQISVDYGDTSSSTVPDSGGTVTYTLTPSPEHAPKRRGDINSSFRCPAVSTTVQVQVPPRPGT